MNVFKIQKLPPLGNPQVTININKKTKLNKNSKIQTPQMSNGLFLSVMFCNPKNYVIYLLILQQTKWYNEILKDF
jgi:hypothetical protein